MQLKELNKAAVQPAGRPVRILQFGEGNFLRAFVDWQIDIANEKGGNGRRRSRGACRRFSAGSAIKRLQAQDGLYPDFPDNLRVWSSKITLFNRVCFWPLYTGCWPMK